jgi:hypothetical protein
MNQYHDVLLFTHSIVTNQVLWFGHVTWEDWLYEEIKEHVTYLEPIIQVLELMDESFQVNSKYLGQPEKNINWVKDNAIR